jgi:hypothetical protein
MRRIQQHNALTLRQKNWILAGRNGSTGKIKKGTLIIFPLHSKEIPVMVSTAFFCSAPPVIA